MAFVSGCWNALQPLLQTRKWDQTQSINFCLHLQIRIMDNDWAIYVNVHLRPCMFTPIHVRVCVHTRIKEGDRKLTCRLIAEISWTDSSADEWLRINRLLFSLNSCLSTSLIKTTRWERKSNQPMKTDFSSSPSALKMKVLCSSYTSLPGEGAVPQHMSTHEQRPWDTAVLSL